MPAGDGTGPMGVGPMTGRGAGYCAGLSTPGYMNPMPGRGWGIGRRWVGWGRRRGRGRGRGWGQAYYPVDVPAAEGASGMTPHGARPSGEHELRALRTQAEYLEDTLNDIKKRLAELETALEKKR